MRKLVLILLVFLATITMRVPLVRAWNYPLNVIYPVYDSTISSGSQELIQISTSGTIAPYQIACTQGSGTITVDAPGTASTFFIDLDCAAGDVLLIAPPFRVYANATGHVTVGYYSLVSGCTQEYMDTYESYTMGAPATVWAVGGFLTLNNSEYQVLPQPYGDTAPWSVEAGDVINNEYNVANAHHADILIICPPEPTPTSTPTLPSTGCSTYVSHTNGSDHRIAFTGSLVGYSVTLMTTERSPSITHYQDLDTPIGGEDWLIYNVPYLISVHSPLTFIVESDVFSVQVCTVGDSSTFTPTRTSTRTAIPTNVVGITMTPRPDCRSVSVSFDSFYTYPDLSPPDDGPTTYALYVSNAFTIANDEYVVAVNRQSGSGISGVAVGDMRTPDAIMINMQIDINGVTYDNDPSFLTTSTSGFRTIFSQNVNYVDVHNALYTPNATIRVWFKHQITDVQPIDHYEICHINVATPTPTTTSNSVQLTTTPTIAAANIATAVCIPITSTATIIVYGMPDLSLSIPTLQTLPTIGTVTSTPLVDVTAIALMVASAQAQIDTPMAQIDAIADNYSWASGAQLSQTVVARADPALVWFGTLNPNHPAWSNPDTVLWAMQPGIGPILPVLGGIMLAVIGRFVLAFIGLILKIFDVFIKLIELIPGE